MTKKILAMLAALPLASCDVEDTTLQITKFVEPSSSCVADPGAIQAFSPVIDIGRGKAMILGMVVKNNLQKNDGEIRVNSNDAQMDSFKVTLAKTTSPAGKNINTLPFKEERVRPTNFVVEAQGSSGGFLVAWDVGDGANLTLADPTKPGEIQVTVHGQGHLLDGSDVESNDAQIIVTVCQGCLPACPTGKKPISACGPGFEGVAAVASCL